MSIPKPVAVSLGAVVANDYEPAGLGWYPDLPDLRDYKPVGATVAPLVAHLDPWRDEEVPASDEQVIREQIEFWPSADDQGSLPTSTVHACIALVQYLERRATGKRIRPSRMFLYHTARRVTRCEGVVGIPLRAALKAMVRFGIPPEEYFPYDPANVDRVPEAALFAYSRDYSSIRYVRLDPHGTPREAVLPRVKRALAAGFPCAFGFPVYSSISRDPEIPRPCEFDALLGGQAAVAAAYCDDPGSGGARGQLLVRNSWGADWGDAGYGYLPYEYVTSGLASDFWTLLKPEWLTEGSFAHPFADAA